ncbi:MAG: RodZ domain-containing protein [Pseudomonadota bacterium]
MMEEKQSEMMGNEERQPKLKVGAILRTEREARGLSVEEIAERVKYSVRQVEALEHDDAEHLPQGTFLRGFVRSYARVLGMDESKLLEVTHTHTDHHFDVEDVQAGGAPLPITGDASRRSRYLMLGALAVAILLAGFVWTHPEDISLPNPLKTTEEISAEPASSASTESAVGAVLEKPVETPATEPAKIEEVQDPAPVAKKPEAPKPAPAVKPAAPAKVAEVTKPVAAPKPLVASPPQEVAKPDQASTTAPETETSAPPKAEVPLAQLMKRPIHIVFNEDAWMEIIDVNGEILLSRVTKAGEEKWIGGGHRAPYDVTIGRPAAIRMYYHGKEVDLSQFNPASVAKLVLE